MAKAAFGGGMLTSLRASFGDDAGAAMKLRLDQVEEDPNQPRQAFEPDELEQLAASIRMVGVLQPIAVRPLEGDRYRLVYGARRLRAAKLAGRSHIPAYVVEDQQAGLAAQVIENQLRAGLSNSDLAEAIRRLSEGGMKVKEIAVVTGLPDWRLRHFRAVPTLPPFLMTRLDQADMRALYELQGAWEKARGAAREALEAAVERLPRDEALTVTEARRIIGAATGKPKHSIVLEPAQEVPADPSFLPATEGATQSKLPTVSPSADRPGDSSEPLPKPLATPSNTKPATRTEVVVTTADGKRGALVLNKKPSSSGFALVEVEGLVVELPCGELRLVEVR